MSESLKKEKIIVIGAGPAGLSCAYELAKNGYQVLVIEASEHVGGMSRSFNLWGQRVDLGPHRFFSKQKEINDFFKALIKDDYILVNRQTRILYNGDFLHYPLKLRNILKSLPFGTIIRILWDYLMSKLFPIKNPKNIEEWVTNRFGKKLYELFFKSYTEKLWGIKCTEIGADWAAQRIKSLSLSGAIQAAIFGNRGNKHKTLVDQFAYPKNGTGTIYERAAMAVEEFGGEIMLNTPVKRVLLNDSTKRVEAVELVSGVIHQADYVVSTMPITSLIKGFNNVPSAVLKAASGLRFRNTILIYFEIDHKDLFTDNWLYIHAKEVKHGRITNFRNWSPDLYGDHETTIVCMEYWCFEEDEIWTEDESKTIALAKEEILKINLLPENVNIINAKVVKVPKCYPVYEIGCDIKLEQIKNYLNTIENLFAIGRYGSFKYNNQDHSILMGFLAANSIKENKPIDLWKVNSDSEYLEEGELKELLKGQDVSSVS
ncbi:MAG: FAD-dependent oxidoreductase [Flavobacteriales bacterium]|nr:FAD-dependent oxidoreductase [Flavobacteriales bacterium]